MGWEFGSGNRTDYDLSVVESYFAPDASYMSGEAILLHLVGHDEDGEECKEIYSVGKDWVSTDGGKTIQSNKGGKAKINASSMYARFCQAAIACGIGELLEKRGDVTEAKVWQGLVFHMDEKEQTFGRDIKSTYRNMPTAYIGLVDTPATKSSTKPSPAVDKVAAAKAKLASTAPTNGHSDIFSLAVAAANSSPDYDTFVSQAVEIPGLTDDDELLTLVVDPSDNGFYANNKASV